MRDQLRLVAWLLMVTGGLMLLVSAFADPLALGMPGSSFGWKQAMGCVLGGLIALGGWRFHARLDRADVRDAQRARQRRAAANPVQPAPVAAPVGASTSTAGAASHEPAQVPVQVRRPVDADLPVSAPAADADARDARDARDWTSSPAPMPDIRANLAATRAMADTAELPRGVVREDDDDPDTEAAWDDAPLSDSARVSASASASAAETRAAEVARAQAAARAARERQLQRAREREREQG